MLGTFEASWPSLFTPSYARSARLCLNCLFLRPAPLQAACLLWRQQVGDLSSCLKCLCCKVSCPYRPSVCTSQGLRSTCKIDHPPEGGEHRPPRPQLWLRTSLHAAPQQQTALLCSNQLLVYAPCSYSWAATPAGSPRFSHKIPAHPRDGA